MPRHDRFPGRCRSFTYEVRPSASSAWIRPRNPSRTWRNAAKRSASGPSTRLPRLIARRHHGVERAAGQVVHALARPARAVDPDLTHHAHRLRTQAARLEARTRDLEAL